MLMQENSWEKQLKQGLDTLSDVSREEPPNLADLQMLVAQVQREQRQQTGRDLALFWLAALLTVSLAMFVFSQRPVYFLVFQGLVFVCLLGGGVVWLTGRKRVTE